MVDGNDENIPLEFEKRVNRDKKIIYVAIALVAVIIVLYLLAIPVIQDGAGSYPTYDLSGYPDISSTSGINVQLTDVRQDSDGWCWVYGKITPKSINTTDYRVFVTYNDRNGYEITMDFNYLEDDNGEMRFSGTSISEDVGSIDVNLIDDKDNIVAKTSYNL
ncbi:hypothetical protein [uncultured Methanobrevibacter sp.]|uniref:hypothetical protein n=1 Tax=uncultured Methanobrevibacter sp. TaxID=253161 RepID=UPI0025D8B4BA|nr:hypothetical protein [uncultured Methanobrevibacter sp.]